MSASQQILLGALHVLTKPLFQPLLTGPLLYLITKGPMQIRIPILVGLSKLPIDLDTEKVTKVLKWLVIAGTVSKINAWLNELSLNHWKLFADKKAWKWEKELAVVTGGCSGIGKVVVQGLEAAGVKVAVIDIQPLPKDLASKPNVSFFKCDITNSRAVKSTASEIQDFMGKPTILVNNAGIGKPLAIADMEDGYLSAIFGVNLISHFYLVREFLPDMVKRNKGHIVTVASMASFVAVPGIAPYAATKAGALAFHETLNQEIRHKHNATGVLTTVVHPNWTSTPLVQEHEDQLRKANGPLMTPEFVGGAMVKQILSARGAQLILPEQLTRVTSIRGWPNWLQELLRDIIGSSSKGTF